MKKILVNNKGLLGFIILSYLDKFIIFLLPLGVLSLYDNKTIYITIEYIYSIVIIIVPFLDLGLSSYFFYLYRDEQNKIEIIERITKTFHMVYIVLFLIGLCIIGFHYLIYPIDQYIIYIISRSLFLVTFSFLTAYNRIIDKPHRALFITISSNVLSLIFLALFFFSKNEFSLWLIFIGQILFCIVYFMNISVQFLSNSISRSFSTLIPILRGSILFSWPNIFQAFVLMYIANYGKINALNHMYIDDGVILSLSQRFTMLIQLSHTAILGFLIKEIYINNETKEIDSKIFLKYLLLLFVTAFIAVGAFLLYLKFQNLYFNSNLVFLNLFMVTSYTITWCIYAYFEIYYSRENKNIIKLVLALVNCILFIVLYNTLKFQDVANITIAMFVSTFITLLLSILTLRLRNYKFV